MAISGSNLYQIYAAFKCGITHISPSGYGLRPTGYGDGDGDEGGVVSPYVRKLNIGWAIGYAAGYVDKIDVETV